MKEEKIIVPRMATIKEAAKIFSLSEHYIRQLVISGTIVASRTGNKYLVNVDKLIEYFNTNRITSTDENCFVGAHNISPIAI